MQRFLYAALALAGACLCAAASGADEDGRWRLTDLYATAADWNADADKLTAQMREFGACKGHLGDNVQRFRQCFELRSDIDKRLERMAVYAGEQLAADTGDAGNLALSQRMDLLASQVDEAQSFVDPEVLKLGKPRVDRLLAADPALAVYRYPVGRILRSAAHTLDGNGEALVARFGQMSNTGGSAYGVLTNSDIQWPKLDLGGKQVTLDAATYTRVRSSADRDERKRVFDAFFGTFKTYERTMGVLLASQLKQDTVFSSVRHYPSSIAAALDGHHVPVAVYDTLIAQTAANLPTLHRYFRLRARMLGLTDLRYHDIYPPLVQGDYTFPLAQGRQLVLDAVAPLGADYVAMLAKGFDSQWMDTYPRPRKQSGAHMAGEAYDVHPYVLMNYNDDYESVTTMAHEWGHAMHSSLANAAQPYPLASYPIFIAEIASTFNEALLLDRMLKAARTDDERLFYLGSALEGLRGTYFRQAMFADFERTVHAQSDNGDPLTGDSLTKTYCDLLKRYHGAAEGVMTIDDAYCTEWAYIPHFYNAFYVYQYATSIAASSLFAERVAAGDQAQLTRYLALLKAGGSADPYDLVKQAGVDLATPAPYQAIAARMNRIMDEIEAILAKRT